MESFKESGSIEYTSDILMGLEYTNKITSNDSRRGYAGNIGEEIDAIQIRVIS